MRSERETRLRRVSRESRERQRRGLETVGGKERMVRRKSTVRAGTKIILDPPFFFRVSPAAATFSDLHIRPTHEHLRRYRWRSFDAECFTTSDYSNEFIIYTVLWYYSQHCFPIVFSTCCLKNSAPLQRKRMFQAFLEFCIVARGKTTFEVFWRGAKKTIVLEECWNTPRPGYPVQLAFVKFSLYLLVFDSLRYWNFVFKALKLKEINDSTFSSIP